MISTLDLKEMELALMDENEMTRVDGGSFPSTGNGNNDIGMAIMQFGIGFYKGFMDGIK